MLNGRLQNTRISSIGYKRNTSHGIVTLNCFVYPAVIFFTHLNQRNGNNRVFVAFTDRSDFSDIESANVLSNALVERINDKYKSCNLWGPAGWGGAR